VSDNNDSNKSSEHPQFAIGIDLGTTNCVVAYKPVDSPMESQVLEIPQLVAPNQTESFSSLPSFLYLLTSEQQQSDDFTVRFDGEQATGSSVCAGRYAREQSAEHPDRVVAAAKSWLSNESTDRHAKILPWTGGFDDDTLAESGASKISPVRASQFLLEHLIAAWAGQFPNTPMAQQQITLTVPACFDEVARQLTRAAAIAAGLPENLILLEEPQAAMYHWIEQQQDRWRSTVAAGDSVLIVDVGGGTTDLTLISVDENEGDLELERRAVGAHLLVGGDNMDLALAHYASQKFSEAGHVLNPWQSVALWHACRAAKETLLATNSEADSSHTITVLGRGRKLIGNSISIEVNRNEIEQLLIEGFLPECNLESLPDQSLATGFQEVGLPYESDTGVTRHVAAFVKDHCDEGLPTHLLLNGGVFQSEQLRARLQSVISSWNSSKTIDVLGGPEDLDEAVARGACYYGRAKLSGGIRIRGGTARSYYIGIETAGLAVPGMPRPLNALCVLPSGTEEGTELDIPSKAIGLVVGKKASFRFFESQSRPSDSAGTVLRRWDEEELKESSTMELQLDASDADGPLLPIKFHSKINEVGVFELWCLSESSDQQWRMELNTRSTD
jgi:actin-like ATPase involved in cell morphogenesis